MYCTLLCVYNYSVQNIHIINQAIWLCIISYCAYSTVHIRTEMYPIIVHHKKLVCIGGRKKLSNDMDMDMQGECVSKQCQLLLRLRKQRARRRASSCAASSWERRPRRTQRRQVALGARRDRRSPRRSSRDS